MKYIKVFWFILKVSFIAFGGGNALNPVIKKECVDKLKWLDEDEFDDLVITTNMIPGPSAVETLAYISIKQLGKLWGSVILILALLPHLLFALGLFISAELFLPKEYLWTIELSVMPVIIGVLVAFTFRYVKMSQKEIGLPWMIFLSLFTFCFCFFIPFPWNIPIFVMIAVILVVVIVTKIKQNKAVK